MIRLCKYFLAVYVFACLLGFESLTAQNSNSGQIVGSVTDTSNAQIAGVTVKATNLDTGAELTAETNGDGLYDLPSVPLGNYTLTFSRSGFSTYIRKGLTLSIQTITVNATLPIGADTQQVEVTAATPLLETETTEQQLTITSQTIETAPIVNRREWNTGL
jgi:topoisomerase IA-like protein